MFSCEPNGYSKKEVDSYISSLKAESEKNMMNEKLKVLDSERKVLEIMRKAEDYKKQIIVSAFDTFKKNKESEDKSIYIEKAEKFKKIYSNIQKFLRELNNKYPGILLNNTSYKKIMNDIEDALENDDYPSKENINLSEGDTIRLLINSIKKSQSSPKEVVIEKNLKVPTHVSKNRIKPVTSLKLDKNDKYDNLVDKFLDTKPQEDEEPKIEIQSNGFDLKEAINPIDDLNEIMKAFDFYSLESNKADSGDYDF